MTVSTVQPCLEQRALFYSPHLRNAEEELNNIQRTETRLTMSFESCCKRCDSIKYISYARKKTAEARIWERSVKSQRAQKEWTENFFLVFHNMWSRRHQVRLSAVKAWNRKQEVSKWWNLFLKPMWMSKT